MFSSLTVDVNSATPYTDATQVRARLHISGFLFICLEKLGIFCNASSLIRQLTVTIKYFKHR